MRRSSSCHLESAVNPGNAKKNNLCPYHKSMEDCLNFIKSTAFTKNEKSYKLKLH